MSAHEGAVVDRFASELGRRHSVISWAVASLCVAMFALQMYWGAGQPIVPAARMGAEIPSRVLAGEWWRLFSVMLLHGNLLHLAFNMMALLSFGPFLERLIGSGRYLTLYVLSGVGGSLLSLTRGGDGIGVGASGGVWGLMVAGAVVATWPRQLIPSALATGLRQRAWTPVFINLLYSLQPGIDMLAHVGGGLAGGVLVWLLTARAEQGPLRRSVPFGVLGGLVGALLLSATGLAFAEGKPWQLISSWTMKRVELEGAEGLSLKVPEHFELLHEANSPQWRWGNLNTDGAELFVMADTFSEPVEEEEALAVLLEEAQKPMEGFHFLSAPSRKTLPSGRVTYFAALKPNDVEDVRFLWQWWFVDRNLHTVLFLVNALDSTSAERRAQLEAMADSFAVLPAP